ncbi:MAG: hypothetical protein SGCHY_001285 [Lobulomycetales sp.]
MGADVIKVENTRSWGPPFVVANGYRESAYFLGLNRNKRSIAIDFRKPAGCQLIKDLAADIVVENFVPGKLDSLGLGYRDLEKANPRLIHCSITGYGPDGPYAKRPGYDVIIEAEAGLMHITGTKDHPVKVGVAITDITTGLNAKSAILAALYAREKSGKGQKIDVSLLECQVSSLANIGYNFLLAKEEGTRWGTQHNSIVPYQAFDTLDSQIILGVGNQAQWVKFCAAIGRPDLAHHAKFKTNEKRVANREELIDLLSEILSRKPSSFWLKEFEAIGIPNGPLNNMERTFSHPQVLHREMVTSVDHPKLGTIPQIGPAVQFSGTPSSVRLPPPMLSEHVDQILNVVGYSEEKKGKLIKECVVFLPR